MKKPFLKFQAQPSFRKSVVAGTAIGSVLSAGFAAADDMSAAAVTAISSAGTQGTTVGNAVVGVVAALCVVGIIIAVIRKV